MAMTSHVIKMALKDAGLYVSEGDSVPADYLNPVLEILRNIIAELNTQSAISFEQKSDTYTVSSDKLTFKPYTEGELETIAGGGAVDITDRFIDFIPLVNPTVYSNGYHLECVSYRDLIDRRNEGSCSCYCFNVTSASSELIFNAIAGSITLLRNVPIAIDDEPYGEIHIPHAFVHYLTTKLTEAVAIRYQFHETASIFAQKGERTGDILARNNVSRRPIKLNLMAGLNRFRR